MLPAITDDMLPPLANPRVPTLDDRALAELLAELEGDDSAPLDLLDLPDDLDLPAQSRSADPAGHASDPLAAPRLSPESTGLGGDALAAPRLAPDPTGLGSEPVPAPQLAPDLADLTASAGRNLAAQVGAVPLPRPDPEPEPGQPPGPRPRPPSDARPGQPPGPRPRPPLDARPGQPFGAGAGQPPGPRLGQPLGARPGRAPGSRAGAAGSPLGHSGVGPVIRSQYGDFRPPVARGSDVPTGLTGLTRKSRSKVGSVLFTVVFIAIFILILIQALASVFTASAGH